MGLEYSVGWAAEGDRKVWMKSMEEKEQPATVHNLLQTRINNRMDKQKTKQNDKHQEIPSGMEDGSRIDS